MEETEKIPAGNIQGITRREFIQRSLLPLIALPFILSTTDKVTAQQLSLPRRMNGIHLPSWSKGEYQQSSTLQSLQKTSIVAHNFIGIQAVQYQENIDSTNIGPTKNTATDDDLRFIIDRTHRLGYPVMFTPIINLSADPGRWHGEIGTHFTERQWESWFGSYRNMIYRYAELAKETGTELFVIGNEYLPSSLNRPNDWASTVDGIRARYRGPLTYAAHFHEFNSMTWWSKLDLLGVNPYFTLTENDQPALDELRSSWRQIATNLEAVALRENKMMVFPEIGYASSGGASKSPWNFDLITDPNVPVNVNEQANCIRALYEALWPKRWWYGVSWWHWDTNPNIGGISDKSYTPRGKPAAAVIRAYGNAIRRISNPSLRRI